MCFSSGSRVLRRRNVKLGQRLDGKRFVARPTNYTNNFLRRGGLIVFAVNQNDLLPNRIAARKETLRQHVVHDHNGWRIFRVTGIKHAPT
jgi:hypothetical protein